MKYRKDQADLSYSYGELIGRITRGDTQAERVFVKKLKNDLPHELDVIQRLSEKWRALKNENNLRNL